MIRRLSLLHHRSGQSCLLATWSTVRGYTPAMSLEANLKRFLQATEGAGLGISDAPVEDPTVLYSLVAEMEELPYEAAPVAAGVGPERGPASGKQEEPASGAPGPQPKLQTGGKNGAGPRAGNPGENGRAG
jgi:hypothetical protein